MLTQIERYKKKVEKELFEDILPFWSEHVTDRENGGFYGWITNDLTIQKEADKGAVLCTRILWTFAAAARLYGKPQYLETARHAYRFIQERLWDKEQGGIIWMTDYRGNPVNTRKQIYAQAFAIYAFAEYYRVVQEEEVLQRAKELFRQIEMYGYDPVYKGYIEACTQDWKPIEDMRLSDKDMNERKSMNTCLHVLEAYANLLRVWDNDLVRERLGELVHVMQEHIIDRETGHCYLFFDDDWTIKCDRISFGHDIEASWLMCDAAEILGQEEDKMKVDILAQKMAESVYKNGLDLKYGGIYDEMERDGSIKDQKPWWPQAEAAVGFLNAYQLSSDNRFFEASRMCWEFIEDHVVDTQYGEWFWKVSREGKPFMEEPKVEPWKCPYHNARACFEVIRRLEAIEKMNR